MTNKKVAYFNVVILFIVLYSLDFTLTYVLKVEGDMRKYQIWASNIGLYFWLLGSIFYLRQFTDFNEEKKQLMWIAIPGVVSGLYTLWFQTLPLAHYGIYQMVNYSIWIVFGILFAILNIQKKMVTRVRADLFLIIIFAIIFLDDATKALISPMIHSNIIIAYVFLAALWGLIGYCFFQKTKASKEVE